MMRRRRAILIITCLLAGMVLALVVWPRVRLSRALDQIAADDAALRRMGWRELTWQPDPDKPMLAETHLDRIAVALETTGDDALLEAGQVLRLHGLWGWSLQPHALLLREVTLLARGRLDGEHLNALDLLAAAPDTIDPAALVEPLNALVTGRNVSTHLRRRAFDIACAKLGLTAPGTLDSFLVASDHELARRYHLVLGWIGAAPDRTDAHEAPEMLAVQAMQLVLARPDDIGWLLELLEQNSSQASNLPFVELLRHSTDPRAREALQQMHEDGSELASAALRTMDCDLDAAHAKSMFEHPDATLSQQYVALWRRPTIPEGAMRELFSRQPEPPDQPAFTRAMLVERFMSKHDRSAFAELWLRSLNDDDKRAGALLAALIGEHADLLRRALQFEDEPLVRKTHIVALLALGATDVMPGAGERIGFAHFSIDDAAKPPDPDMLLCRLAAGRVETITHLVATTPATPLDLQARAWMIERFLPHWYARMGRPLASDPDGLALYFDTLHAAWLVEREHLYFNPATKAYELRE
jgi:hypothetical protein